MNYSEFSYNKCYVLVLKVGGSLEHSLPSFFTLFTFYLHVSYKNSCLNITQWVHPQYIIIQDEYSVLLKFGVTNQLEHSQTRANTCSNPSIKIVVYKKRSQVNSKTENDFDPRDFY